MKKIVLTIVVFVMMTTSVFALPAAQKTKLTWDPPTTNSDGSPLTDLAGYKIYWKSSVSGAYTDVQSKDVGNVTTVTIQSVTGSSTAVYYFVATSYNTNGTESKFSNEVDNKLPLAPGAVGLKTSP